MSLERLMGEGFVLGQLFLLGLALLPDPGKV